MSRQPTTVPDLLTEKDFNISVEALEEHIPIKGNAIASGDDAYDRKIENKIRRDLNNGNEWAWCCVRVALTPKDTEFCELEASAYLGCCCYKSKKDFIKSSGYYEDMVAECISELAPQMGR